MRNILMLICGLALMMSACDSVPESTTNANSTSTETGVEAGSQTTTQDFLQNETSITDTETITVAEATPQSTEPTTAFNTSTATNTGTEGFTQDTDLLGITTTENLEGRYLLHFKGQNGELIAIANMEIFGDSISGIVYDDRTQSALHGVLEENNISITANALVRQVAAHILEDGTVEGSFENDLKLGSITGYRYTEVHSGPSRYDGSYRVNFIQSGEATASGYIQIENGVFQSNLQYLTSETIKVVGRVLLGGAIRFNSVNNLDVQIALRGTFDGDSFKTDTRMLGSLSGSVEGSLEKRNDLDEQGVQIQSVVNASSDRIRAVVTSDSGARIIVSKENSELNQSFDRIVLETPNGARGVLTVGETGSPKAFEVNNYIYEFAQFIGESTVGINILSPNKAPVSKKITFETLNQLNFRMFAEGDEEPKHLLNNVGDFIEYITCALSKEIIEPENQQGWDVVMFGCSSYLVHAISTASNDELTELSKTVSTISRPFEILRPVETKPHNVSLELNFSQPTSTSVKIPVRIQAEDDTGIIGYYLAEGTDSVAPSIYSDAWVSVGKTTKLDRVVSFTFVSPKRLGDFIRTVRLWILDEEHQISEAVNKEITLKIQDSQAPSAPDVIIQNGADETSKSLVTLTLSASDDKGVTGFYVSEDSIVPEGHFPGWTDISETPLFSRNIAFNLTPNQGGERNQNKIVNVWFKDAAGNVSPTAIDNITMLTADTTPPELPSLIIGGGESTVFSAKLDVDLSAIDTDGVVAYYLSQNMNAPKVDHDAWISIDKTLNYSDTVNYVIQPIEGFKEEIAVYGWFKDESGNISTVTSDRINIDLSDTPADAQQQTAISINNGDETTNLGTVTLNLFAGDPAKSVAFYVSEKNTTPELNAPGWTYISPASASFASDTSFNLSSSPEAGDHVKTVYYWVLNSLGKISKPISDNIILRVQEVVPPGDIFIAINNGDEIADEPAVTVSLAATDNVAVSGYILSQNPITPAVDDAKWVFLDIPVSEFAEDVSFTITPDDSSSPKSTVYVWFQDSGGNISSSRSTSINLRLPDEEAPKNASITVERIPPFDTLVDIQLRGTDNSGISAYYIDTILLSPEEIENWVEIDINQSLGLQLSVDLQPDPDRIGEHERVLYVWFRDIAGNISEPVSDAVFLIGKDIESPTDVTLTLNLPDDGEVTIPTVGYTVEASDNAGVKAIFLTENPPTVPPVDGDPGWINIPVQEEVTYSSAFEPDVPARAGTHTKYIYLWVKDEAGNVSEEEVRASFIYTVPSNLVPSELSLVINSGEEMAFEVNVDVFLQASDARGIAEYYIRTDATEPGRFDSGWLPNPSGITDTFSQSLAFALDASSPRGDSDKLVCAWFKNTEGYISDAVCDSIVYRVFEREPPEVHSVAINSGAASTTEFDVEVDVEGEDNILLLYYYASESDTIPDADASNVPGSWIATPEHYEFDDAIPFTLATETTPGVYEREIYVWFQDASGNVSPGLSDTIDLVIPDLEDPANDDIAIIFLDEEDEDTLSDNNSGIFPWLEVSLSATDNLAVSHYLLSESPLPPGSEEDGWIALETPETPLDLTTNFMFDHPYIIHNPEHTIAEPLEDVGLVNIANWTVFSGSGDEVVEEETGSGDFTYACWRVFRDNLATLSDIVADFPTLSATVDDVTRSCLLSTETRNLYVWYKDEAGNVSVGDSDSVTMNIPDADPPGELRLTVTSDSGDDNTTSSIAVLLDTSATDNVILTHYYAAESVPADFSVVPWIELETPTNFIEANYNFTLAHPGAAGTYEPEVFIWFKDRAGNISEQDSDTITLEIADTTPPTSTSVSINGGVASTTNAEVNITLSATDDQSVSAYYFVESTVEPVAPEAGDSRWNTVEDISVFSLTVSYTFNSASFGDKTIYAWFKDNTGNVSEVVSATVTLQNDPDEEMIFIPAGTFAMGDGFSELAADTRPAHNVTFTNNFYISKHEITVRQYQSCVEAGGCSYTGSTTDPHRTYGVPGKEVYPLNFVSWDEAQTYISWRNSSEVSDYTYRLCTEAEWEYAARGGTSTRWPCAEAELDTTGNVITPECVGSTAWYADTSTDEIHAVAEKNPNDWGLYDMGGNLAEWVEDYYENPYPSAADITDPTGPGSGTTRVIRGGHFLSAEEDVRPAARGNLFPTEGNFNTTFRVCATQTP